MDVRELIDRVLATVNGNQAELARRLGRSETTISRWVTGRNGIDYESALRIARMTGLPPRQVLESAGLDAELFPASGTEHADLGKAEWNALYDQMDPKTRSTVVPMVRVAANTSAEPTANHSGRPVNGRRRGLLPPLESHNRRGIVAYASSLVSWIWRPLRPAPAMAAVSA